MVSRKSRHKLLRLWKRNFVEPFMVESFSSSDPLHSFHIHDQIRRRNSVFWKMKSTHVIKYTFWGSYVRSLFKRSNPASESTGDPVKDVAGNFLLNRLYLKQKKVVRSNRNLTQATETVTNGGLKATPESPKAVSLGNSGKRNNVNYWDRLKEELHKHDMDTYWCLTKFTLTPGSLENPGQIASFGVPRILKICIFTPKIRVS